MPFAHSWDISIPPDTQPANLLGQDCRDIKQDTMQRIAAISGTLAALPAPEVTSPTVDWTGILYFTTDTAQVFRWSGTAWVDVTSLIGTKTVLLDVGGVELPVNVGFPQFINIPANTIKTGALIEIEFFTETITAPTVLFSFGNIVALVKGFGLSRLIIKGPAAGADGAFVVNGAISPFNIASGNQVVYNPVIPNAITFDVSAGGYVLDFAYVRITNP